MAVNRLGQTFGTVGGGCGEHEVVTAALRVLRTGKNELITVDMTNDIAENEGMVCGGKMHVYICRGEEMFAGNYGAART
jgi:xanthine dehydrogenase accessory factor